MFDTGDTVYSTTTTWIEVGSYAVRNSFRTVGVAKLINYAFYLRVTRSYGPGPSHYIFLLRLVADSSNIHNIS